VTDELYLTLLEANEHDWESVRSVMDRDTPRARRLLAHILETKHLYWTMISSACDLEPPMMELELIMRYELEQVARLTPAQRAITLEYSGKTVTIAALVRLNARHSAWHAGQIALRMED
jgi:hypothetical protein